MHAAYCEDGWYACNQGGTLRKVGRPAFMNNDVEKELYDYVKDVWEIGGPVDLETLVVLGTHVQQQRISSSNAPPDVNLTRTWTRYVLIASRTMIEI